MGRVKDKLLSLDVRPSKERGQNFVIDDSVIRSIIEFGNPQAEDTLVEIGPGLGALTKELSRFPKLTLVEIEEKFCEELRREYPAAQIIQADVRMVNFPELGEDLVVFGNLPYVYSTDIVFLLLANAPVVRRAVLLLQREFAERLAAPPGGRDYGRISVAVQLWADLALGPIIQGDSFHPPTEVQSRLVELKLRKEPKHPIEDYKWFEKVVKASFLQRRKKLVNSLKASGYFKPASIDQSLAGANIDPGRRAETLSLEEFVTLSKNLKKP